jgi:hypothetical protein
MSLIGWLLITIGLGGLLLLNTFSPMCNLNFSFMGGVGNKQIRYINFDMTSISLLGHIPSTNGDGDAPSTLPACYMT